MPIAPPTLSIGQAGPHANVQLAHKVPASGEGGQPGYHTIQTLKGYFIDDLKANVDALAISLTNDIANLANLNLNFTSNLASLTASIGGLDNRLDNLEVAYAGNVARYDIHIAGAEANITALFTALSSNLASINTRFTSDELTVSNIDTRLTATETRTQFGNSTANLNCNSVQIWLANSSATTNVVPGFLHIGKSYVNGSYIFVTSGFWSDLNSERSVLSDNRLYHGNSTSNVSIFSNGIWISAPAPLANIVLQAPTIIQVNDPYTFFRANGSWTSINNWFLANTQLSTDGTLSTNSNSNVPSVQAVKTYVDQLLGAQDAFRYINDVNCSTNPNYPAANRGDVYRVSVAGKIGGAAGVNVEAGDTLLCRTDGSVAGDQATVGANWNVTQGNIDGAVIGPASAVQYSFAQFSDTSGKLIQGGVTMDNDFTLSSNSATRLPTQQATKKYVDVLTASLPLASQAVNVYYSNLVSGFAANNLQQAFDNMYTLFQNVKSAADITYSNTLSTLTANTVQTAVDQLSTKINSITVFAAANVSYSNTSSALTANTVQTAVDQLYAKFSNYQPADTDLTAIAALTTTSIGRSLLAAANAEAIRTIAGTVIGTTVQAYDADLDAIAALSTTSTGRSLLAAADASAIRTIAGVDTLLATKAPINNPSFTGDVTGNGTLRWGRAFNVSNTDLDVLVTPGFYDGGSLVHSPDGSISWFYIMVQQHSSTSAYVVQTAWYGGSTNAQIYTRYRFSGTWSAWTKTLTYNNYREPLAANRTYYVRTDGSDTNDGLTNANTGAFATLQHAYDVISNFIDFKGFTVTIQVADGTYTSGISITNPWHGGGTLVIQGNTTTKANCIIDIATSSSPFYISATLPGQLGIKGFKLRNTYTSAVPLVQNSGRGTVVLSNLELAGASTTGYNGMIHAGETGARIILASDISITGSAAAFIAAVSGGNIQFYGQTITVTGALNFSWAFAAASGLSEINMGGATFNVSGATVTGQRYLIGYESFINTGNAGENYFPGNINGLTHSGAIYDNVYDPNSIANCRLTLQSGVPIMTTSQSAKTTLYLTPYKGNRIALWTGARWKIYTFSELSLDISALAVLSVYDIFLYDNNGTLTIHAVSWTNDTTRATALARQDGVLVKSGDATKRYIGTIRTSFAAQCEFSFGGAGLNGISAILNVWNYYNRTRVFAAVSDTVSNFTYSAQAYAPFNNSITNRITFVRGVNEDSISARSMTNMLSSSTGAGYLGIGLDSTTASVAQLSSTGGIVNQWGVAAAEYDGMPSEGVHYLQLLMYSQGGSINFSGNAPPYFRQSFIAELWM